VRSNSRNILLYITIADLFTAVGYLSFHSKQWEYNCISQSFITTTSSMMSFFWTGCMALYLYAVSIKANYDLGKRIILVFHCIAWPVPLLVSVIALLADQLGKGCGSPTATPGTADWCWIKEECHNGTTTSVRYKTVSWMLLTGKLWEIISYIVIIFVYARIFIFVRKQRKLVRSFM
jgi:G protein-coupled receptor 157